MCNVCYLGRRVNRFMYCGTVMAMRPKRRSIVSVSRKKASF